MEDRDIDWEGALRNPQLMDLMRRRRNTVLILGVFAAICYFSLPALIAWAPRFSTVRLGGGINVGVLFAALQYPLSGLIAWRFLRQTADVDAAVQRLRVTFSSDASETSLTPMQLTDKSARHAR